MDNVAESNKRDRITKGKNPTGYFSLAILGVVVLFIPGYNTADITWTPDLEWDTNGNWVDSLAPENGSHVIFPVEMLFSVGLPAVSNKPIEIAGIELPRDGALALPETGSLTIIEESPSMKTVVWSRKGPLLWTDPANWNSERSVPAVPHLERIPCQQDVVVLPEESRTVNIRLPYALGTKVRGVRIGKDKTILRSWEWGNILGLREFAAGATTVQYTGLRRCDDCPCQDEETARQLVGEVCAVVRPTCQDLACEYPATVEGHCCDYCGGRVQISNRSLISLVRRIADQGLAGYSKTLTWYARRTWNSGAEVLIAGKDGGYSMEDTEAAIAVLTAALQEQGVEVLDSQITGAPLRLSKTAMILGPFFAGLVIIIVVLFAIFPYFGYSIPQIYNESLNGMRQIVANQRSADVSSAPGPSSLPKPFRFARFENLPESDVELAHSSTHENPIDHGQEDDEDCLAEGGTGRGGRFTNPLYSSGRKAPDEPPSFAALKKAHEELDPDEEIDLTVDD